MILNSVQPTDFRKLLDAAADAMLVMDVRGRVVALNPEAERLFGWTEAELLGTPLNRVIPPRFQQLTRSQPASSTGDSGSSPKEEPVRLFARRKDGTEFPAEFNHSPLDSGEDALVLVTIRDLTRWGKARDSLFREKEQASDTLASIADGIIATDLAGTITYLNPTAERLTGWRISEALGQPLSTVLTLIFEATRQPVESIAAWCLHEGRAVDLAHGVLLLRRDGTDVAIEDSAAPLRDHDGATIGVVLVFRDVTEIRRESRRLSHDATHDALTGLISRQEFEQRLGRLVEESAAVAAQHTLCYLDLDRFKVVNDTCGHEAGDQLLRTIGGMLASRLRTRDTVGRLGGDEFGILLEHCSVEKATDIAGGLVSAIEELRYAWGERKFSLGASIGIVPITAGNGRKADVLRAADHACYAAKNAGGSRVHLARAEPDVEARQTLETRSRRV
jgi:diguanylate cyclase (GGDEF)-like protein/PAS domain S-box-containing protein